MTEPTGEGQSGTAYDWLAGGGAMGARMRAFDWSASPVGPVESWPQSLKTVVRIMLTSRYAMWMAWGPGLTFFYNDAYRPTLGAKHGWALGAPAATVWAEIWADIGPRVEQVLTTGVATWDEALLLYLERNGYPEETYHTFSYSPLADDAGATLGMLCVVTEETERVLGERRLRTLRDLGAQATLAKNTEDACRLVAATLGRNAADVPFSLLYLTDAEGKSARLAAVSRLDRGSAACPEALGLEYDAPGAVWPLAEAKRVWEFLRLSDLRERLPGLPGGPGRVAPHEALVLPLRDAGQGRVAGFLVVGVSGSCPLGGPYRDFFGLVAGQAATAIANANAYEEERRRAESLLELDRAKTAFFSNVSHEFRTPLTLMLGPASEALARADDPAQRERLAVVHRNALRLQKLVNTLLDFSRIEAGRVLASFEETDLAGFTAELAGVFRSAVEAAGLRFHVACEPTPAPAFVDREMWEKIVLNLVSNAFKFTLGGEIEVRLVAGQGAARLSVRDTGVGIAADQLPHVFERFHRVEGVRARTHEGTGIGLALVHELVKLHGGTIEARSAPGVGTEFTVTVPLGRDHLPADRVASARPDRGASAAPGQFADEALRWLPADGDAAEGPPDPGPAPVSGGARPRILLADDNADMRGYVARLLGARYEVRAERDGLAALASARSWRPDLVLTDVMMPGLDGFGLLDALRADPATAKTPVIMLSARAGEEARAEGIESGADDYLTKPFGARELLARVGAHIELTRARRALAAADERAALLLESLTDAFVTLDAGGRLDFANAEAARLVGRSRAELLGRPFRDAFPAAEGGDLGRALARAAADRAPAECDHHDEAAGRWYAVRAYPTADGGLAVTFRDVTEARRTAEARQRLQDDREQLLQRMPIAYVANDRDFRVTDWNPAAEAIFGFRKDEVLGKTPYELFLPPPAHEFVGAIHRRLLTGDMAAHGLNSCVTKGGRTILCEWHNTPLRGPDGAVVGSLSMALDVTERVRSEEGLRQSEGQLRFLSALDAATQPLIDPEAITAVAARALGEHVGADRCAYAEVADDADHFHLTGDFARGVPSIVGRYAFTDFGAEVLRLMRANAPYVVADVATDPRAGADLSAYERTQIRAVVCVPLHKGGRLVAAMAVHQATPRHWKEEEVELVQLVAGRCWESIERARVARSLRESERKYRFLAEGLGQFLWSAGADGRADFVNRHWQEYAGLSLDDTNAGGWAEAVHPDDVAPFLARHAEGSARGEPYEFECRVRRGPGGEYRWFLGRNVPLADPGGPAPRWVGTGIDIHDRKRAEGRQTLLAEAGRILGSSLDYEATLSQVCDLVVPVFSDWCGLDLLTDDGQVRRLTVKHKDPERVGLANEFRRLYPPRPEDQGGIMQVLRTGAPILHREVTDEQLVLGARDPRHLEMLRGLGLRSFLVVPLTARGRTLGALSLASAESSRPFDEADLRLAGELASRAALAVDNAKLFSEAQEAARRREEALHRHRSVEEQLTLLVEASGSLNASPDLASVLGAVLTLSSRLIAADAYAVWRFEPAAGRWGVAHSHGLSDEYKGATIRGLAAPATLPEAPVVAEDVLAAPELGDREAAYVREGIRSLLAAPLKVRGAATGTLVFYYKAPHRFSEVEVRVATALSNLAASAIGTAELYEELKANDRKKDEFLAMLAHELRNPLAAVGNAVSVLRLTDDRANVEFAKGVIERQVRQLARLIDDLLDVSRITNGKIRLRKDLLDAAQVLDQAVLIALPLIEERKHELVRSFGREPLPLRADATRLEQIVVNLLTNAAKYTESGGRIWLEAGRDGGQVVITVRDTGIGIPPEKLPEMFQLFAQGERSIARSEGGLGIGLTVVQKLAELHGGGVTASSAGPGLGSSFTVRLPAAPEGAAGSAAVSAPGATRSNGAAAAGPSPRRGSRVLVVDDNEDTARGMVRLLKLLGHEVEIAHDGPTALARAGDRPPEFVLLDIGLPGMDGYQVARALRDDPRHRDAVLIAISGYGQEEDRRQSRAAGINHHLVKPLDPDALLTLLAAGAGRP